VSFVPTFVRSSAFFAVALAPEWQPTHPSFCSSGAALEVNVATDLHPAGAKALLSAEGTMSVGRALRFIGAALDPSFPLAGTTSAKAPHVARKRVTIITREGRMV
jgi:hypothetical protein